MPIVSFHQFKNKYFDKDDKKYFEQEVIHYLTEEVEYDELFEHKKEVDECLEVSRALLEMTADNAELNVQLTKRPASNGIRQNASKNTKYVDPSSKSGLLLSGWTRFHRQMADENSELASRAIDFNWETPEEVKLWK